MDIDLINVKLPSESQLPIDPVANLIVAALKDQNWSAPHVQVSFTDSKSGTQIVKSVALIEGRDVEGELFRLQFKRQMAWNEGAAPLISQIDGPKHKLQLFGDGSSPILSLYAGSDWVSDQASFIESALSRNEEKPYVTYSGSFTKLGLDEPALLHVVDGKRYIARANLEEYYNLEQVFNVSVSYLREKVLPKIMGN
jgi:hypothetical protein